MDSVKKEENELMTVQEVMKYLKVSRSTIYRFIDQGILKPYKVGVRGTRFKRKDIEEYLESQNREETT